MFDASYPTCSGSESFPLEIFQYEENHSTTDCDCRTLWEQTVLCALKKGTAEQLLYLIDESPSKQRYLQDQVCGVGGCKVPIGEGNVPGQELGTKVQVPVLVQAKSGQG